MQIQWMSENRTSGLENRTLFRPVIELSGYRTSGCIQSVRLSDRLNALGRPITGQDCPDFECPNPIRAFENRTVSCEPDVRNPDNSITGHIFVRFAKPDVRYSDIHCIYYLATFYYHMVSF